MTRWYGGVKLGAGGPVRAYGGAAADCLRRAERVPLIARAELRLDCAWSELAPLQARLRELDAETLAQDFGGDRLHLRVTLPADRVEALGAWHRDLTRGRGRIELPTAAAFVVQSLAPSNGMIFSAARSTSGRHRTLTMTVLAPVSGSPLSANGSMPQVAQKRCTMRPVLKRYVLRCDSGVFNCSASRGKAASRLPRRRQIEQLHSTTASMSPSSVNAILPQWQPPS